MSFQINKRERMKVCVSSSEEELRNTTVEELKRKLIPEDQPDDAVLPYKHTSLQDDHTFGSYKIEHKDKTPRLCRKRIPCSGRRCRASASASVDEGVKRRHSPPEDEDEDEGAKRRPPPPEDEDKIIPKSRSMDNLLLDMQQPQ